MVKKPFRGNYLELKVRVSYDENTDTIHLTSKDKDLPTTRGFHLTLNGGRDAEYVLRNLLEQEGLIPKEMSKIIPAHADFNDAINTDKWDQLPLGLLASGEELVWDSSKSPHLLLAGHTGSGKSVLERNIIFHCLRHPENWVFYGIDFKQVELNAYLKFGNPIKSVATTLDTAFDAVTGALNEMTKRYHFMQKHHVTHFQDLPDVPPAWMIMIDETALLLSGSPTTSQGQRENQIKTRILQKLAEIANLGGPAGIHLVMATQRIDSKMFPESFKANFTTRIATGNMNPIASQMLLDNDKATKLNSAIKGRGYFQQLGEGTDFQGYFSTFHWPYEAGIVKRD